MFIIGSKAIKDLYPDFNREPKDIDVLLEKQNITLENKDGIMYEYHVIPPLYDYIVSSQINNKHFSYADILLTLKASHIMWDINWKKHIYDIVFLFEKKHVIIKPLFYSLYKQLL